jgi:5'-nucleotidase
MALSNPSSWADKVQWVTDHLGDVFHKKIILTHHKNLLNDGKAILIDDRTKHGAETFGDRLIHFGPEQFSDWQAVLKHLL